MSTNKVRQKPSEGKSSDDVLSEYLKHVSGKMMFLLALLFIIILVAVYSTTIGPYRISFWDSMVSVFTHGDSTTDVIIWNLRLPRIVAAILVGAALGVSGAVMQCVLRNPLGSPFTLGISNAAAFGAAIGIIVLGGGTVLGQSVTTTYIDNPYLVTGSAFAWSVVATVIIIVLVKVTKVSPEAMVLTGVAISSIFSAGLAALQYFSNDSALSNIVYWQFGDLGKINWDQNTILFIVVVFICAFFYWKRWDYNALDTGDDVAKGLGVNTDGIRIVSMVLSSLLTAVAVSFVGIIGFIGLLAPHVVRRVVGNDHRFLIPGSMLVGALVLLVSDTVGRNMGDLLNWAFDLGVPSFIIPVGIITSFIGGPLFIYILIRGYKNVDQG
ncbi:MAG: iron ABC transporter permease [Methanomassiliicoccales archaeon]